MNNWGIVEIVLLCLLCAILGVLGTIVYFLFVFGKDRQ